MEAIRYEHDADLEFLGDLSSDHLDPLVRILIADEDGDGRLTEQLTLETRYSQHSPDHAQYWDLVAGEFQDFGSNTFSGKKSYREILSDVCDRSKVNYNKKQPTELIESYLLQKILTDAVHRMSPKDLEEFCQELDIETTNFTKEAVVVALQTAIRSAGFLPYQYAVVALYSLTSMFGITLPFVVYASLTRAIAIFAGPIGLIVTGLWTALKVAGPAYRVTVPATIVIACLRQIHKQEESQ